MIGTWCGDVTTNAANRKQKTLEDPAPARRQSEVKLRTEGVRQAPPSRAAAGSALTAWISSNQTQAYLYSSTWECAAQTRPEITQC